MIVTCEKCGEKYQIDPRKIKGETTTIQCTRCNQKIRVVKPIKKERKGKEKPEPSVSAKRRPWLGLRAKMFILFFLVPIILILAASLLYLWQLNTFSSRIDKSTSDLALQLTEEGLLTKKVRAIALRLQFYLLAHPRLKKQMFNDDLNFRSIALQKIGASDYTFVYEKPGADGIWRIWDYVNPDFIGSDMTMLRESLGESFNEFKRIYTGIKDKGEISGYYSSQDREGVIRKKFMVCTSIEQTSYVAAATGFVPQFTNPIEFMQEETAAFAVRTRTIIIGILLATLLLVGFIVFTYSYRLAGRLRHMSDVADRISMGDFNAEITDIGSNDEIGVLANDLNRMQASIRLAIQRLRERR